MGANENLTIRARLVGANQMAREAARAAAAFRSAGLAARGLGNEVEKVHKRSFLMNQTLFTARRLLYGFTIGASGAAAAAGMIGIKFNATMEQGRIGMGFLLGDTAAANEEMATLLKLSQETVFDLPHITEAGRRLLGMGFDAQQTNEYLMAMSENMAAMGQPVDTMDRIITAFGQIRARGKLAGQEVLQLVNAQVPVYEILREQLHLTNRQLSNIGETGIDANTAISALSRGMTAKFGGANAAMLSTVNGQWQKFKENTQIIMGEVMMSPFTALQKNFPRVLAVMDEMTTAMQNEGFYAMVRSLDEGANASGRLVDALTTLHTFVNQTAAFFRNGLGPALLINIKALAVFLKFLLFVVGGFLLVSSHIPGLKYLLAALITLWIAHKTALMLSYFWERRTAWAIAKSTSWIWKQIGALKAWAFYEKWTARGVEKSWKQQGLFAKAIRWTTFQMKAMVVWTRTLTFSLTGLKTAILTMPIIGWILAIITGLILLEMKWHLISRAIKLVFGWIRKLFNYVGNHKDILLNLIPVIGPALFVSKKILGAFAQGGVAGQSGPYLVGERGPEVVTLPHRSSVTPVGVGSMSLAGAGGGGMHVTVMPQSIQLDGRTIAEVVWKHKLDRFARR